MTRLFAVIFLFFSIPALAQVQAPDYTDKTKWKYNMCDNPMQLQKNETHVVFHEDYASISGDDDILVVYKPIHVGVVMPKLEEVDSVSDAEKGVLLNKLLSLFREQPWVMLYRVGETTHIFEYKDNEWKFEASAKTNGELNRYLEKYLQ